MLSHTSLWEYLPASKYVVPSPPISDAVQGHIARAWSWVRALRGATAHATSDAEEEFACPSDDTLRALAPVLDWQRAALALPDALGDWYDGGAMGGRIRAVIGPPGHGVADVVSLFAAQHQFPVLEAPEPPDVLTHPASTHQCIKRLRETRGSTLVIPHLERFYLRHSTGLALMRELLQQLSADAGRLLLGCDSWAWAYLCKALHLEGMTGPPLALAPFDGERLNHWLHVEAHGGAHTCRFRQAGDGEPVFIDRDPEASPGAEQDEPQQMSTVVQSLAAASRGIPAVARGLWQCSIRTVDTTHTTERQEADGDGPTLWAVPASALRLPTLPASIALTHRFVLHALLLHGGLTLRALLAVLPMPPGHITECLNDLTSAGVVETGDDRLLVAPLAYPAVREHLAQEAFLVDAF